VVIIPEPARFVDKVEKTGDVVGGDVGGGTTNVITEGFDRPDK